MRKLLLSLMAIVWACSAVNAQSKVFKEVSEEMSSQFFPLIQNHAVIGYIGFSRLEKASEDMYNYKVTIMDENLNDLGAVNFKDAGLILADVAFEQDVLCLGYFKTNMIDKTYKKLKQFNAATSGFKNHIMLQFLNLDGKILETINNPIELNITNVLTYKGYAPTGKLKQGLQVINVPEHGFASFYGDDKKNLLSFYQPNGKKAWDRTIKEELVSNLISSGSDVFMLAKGPDQPVYRTNEPNSFELLSYNVKDSSAYPKIKIKDKKNHALSVLRFDIDPVTEKPFISGHVNGLRSNSGGGSAKGIARGYYSGLYTINFNGHTQKEVKEQFVYWDDNSNSDISSKGYFRDKRSYAQFYNSFRDYNGNTYFAADGLIKKIKPGTIASSVILAPLFVISPMILMTGTQKAKIGEPILFKLDNKGKLSYSSPIEGESFRYGRANLSTDLLGSRSYYPARNQDQKQQYLIISEKENSTIYNVSTNKKVRTLPLKDKNIRRAVLPAKDGSIMVMEVNKKEKYTRVSIEAL